MNKKLNGLGLSFLIAAGAFALAAFVSMSAVLIALVFGIVLGNIIKLPENLSPGVSFASSKILEFAIVLMAFGINYKMFMSLGWQTIVLVVVTMIVVLIATRYLAIWLKCPGSTGWLVGFGTAICGSSAIAALAPKITKDKTDIGISLAVVNLYGLLGMVVLPGILMLVYDSNSVAVFLGASLHAVGNVAGAGFSISDNIGELAVTVKLGRVALLTPALLLFGNRFKRESNTGSAKILPWYLILFIVVSLLTTFVSLPEDFLKSVKWLSSFFLATAMAAIGLKVKLKTVFKKGKKGLVFGGLIFAVQMATIAILLAILF